MENTYKAAGVDIDAGEKMVDMIKPFVKKTHNDKVLSGLGLFGGFYEADFTGYKKPVLVSSVDGVGTKLKIAVESGIYGTVGQCLVNHCVDDILCCGAKPLFFLDYFATGKLDPDMGAEVVKGFATACYENDCALIGGETAEMPGIYADGDFDVSGTVVGIVDKDKAITGDKVEKGNVLIGLESTGLQTNGYSLARKVLLSKYSINHHFEDRGTTLASELLAIHKSYLKEVHPLADKGLLNGISHITGGGIVGNTSRVVRDPLKLNIDWKSWEIPFIFNLIQETGGISDQEMRRVFNLGIGMILIVDKNNVDEVMNACSPSNPKIIGSVE